MPPLFYRYENRRVSGGLYLLRGIKMATGIPPVAPMRNNTHKGYGLIL